MRRAAGFTLLELLVATAVLAVMGAMAYQGLAGMVGAARGLEARAEGLRRLGGAVARLERDFRGAVPRGVRDALGAPLPALMARQEQVRLTRAGWDNPLDQPRARLERVGYALQGDRLVRAGWPVLDRGPASEPRELVLLEGVSRFDVDFLAVAGGPWVGAWPPPGSAAGGEPWPLAVRLTLEGPAFGVVERVLALPGGPR